jgi:hypothetical protein
MAMMAKWPNLYPPALGRHVRMMAKLQGHPLVCSDGFPPQNKVKVAVKNAVNGVVWA